RCRCVFGPDRCAGGGAGRCRFITAAAAAAAPTSTAAAAALASGAFIRTALSTRLRALRLSLLLPLLLLPLLLCALGLAAATLGIGTAVSFGLVVSCFAFCALLSVATALLGGTLAFVTRPLTFTVALA